MKNQKNEIKTTQVAESKVAEEVKAVEIEKCRIFIAVGASGAINNGTMIDALKLHLNNQDDIKEIYKFYPEVFKSAAKYLSNREKATLNSYIPELKLEVQQTAAKVMTTKTEEYTMISTIVNSLNNKAQLEKLKADFPELFEKAVKWFTTKINEI